MRCFQLAAVLFGLALSAGLAMAHAGLHEQIRAVSRRIERTPADAGLYLRRADLYRRHRDWRLALADLERAAVLDPETSAAHVARVAVLRESGRLPEALAAARRTRLRWPRSASVRLEDARTLQALGRHRAAARAYEEAFAIAGSARPRDHLARARSLVAAGEPEAAVRALDAAATRLGPVPALLDAALDLEIGLKRFDAALARVDRALKGARRKERWLARRGTILVAAGRTRAARDTFDRALAAIRALPERHRRTASMRALRAHVEMERRRLGKAKR